MTLGGWVLGEGPRLGCLHGWGLNADVWRPLADRLAGELTVQALDLPGHGRSEPGVMGLNNWADAVAEALDGPAVVLGWSLGGVVALNLARRHPARVQGLVLMATLPRMLRGRDWPWGMRASAVAETARGLERDYVSTLQEFLMMQVLAEPGARRLVRALRTQLLDRPPDPDGLRHGLDLLYEADLRHALPALDLPVLLVAGERDRICHPEGMAWTAERLPDARLWRVERAAHAPFLSHEREFGRRVAEFVAASNAQRTA